MKCAAVFVDAGYLYAAGIRLLTGHFQDRSSVELRQRETIAKLIAMSEERTCNRLLRIYWYDGLVGRSPSAEQESLAYTDNVKIRLGFVTAGRQKGVDSLIVTDLIELARNHAISDAVLLSGDEDLRVGVQIAQNFGVRVHLLGIEPSKQNQSNLLMQEADTTKEWNRGDIGEIMALRTVEPREWGVTAGHADSGDGESDVDDPLAHVARQVANALDQDERIALAENLKDQPHWIPQGHDRSLLLACGQRVRRDLTEREKQAVRTEFKKAVCDRP